MYVTIASACKQAEQMVSHDQHSRNREFMIGERVMVRNLRPGPTWIPGTIIERSGPLSYVVQVKGEQTWKRHIEHLREVGDTPVEQTVEPKSSTDLPPIDESESFPVTSDPVMPHNRLKSLPLVRLLHHILHQY